MEGVDAYARERDTEGDEVDRNDGGEEFHPLPEGVGEAQPIDRLDGHEDLTAGRGENCDETGIRQA